MKELIMQGLKMLFGMLKTEDIKDFIDAGLDKIEDKYIEGEVDTPKELAIRLTIDAVRGVAGIKDEDYGSDKNV